MLKRVMSAIVAVLLLLSVPAQSLADDFELPPLMVTFLDVGQGNATLVTCDGYAMLIDGGSSKYSSYMYSMLKQRGINRLEYIIATHPDEDHIGGIAGALNYATAGVLFCTVTQHDTEPFNDFSKYLARQNNKIIVPDVGDRFSLGRAEVEILAPERGETYSDNTSIVAKLTFGDTSFLFTGDAEAEDEDFLMHSGCDLSSTVLAVGHHGSASSTAMAFLNKVKPKYAVISVGAENTYGHPTEEVLKRLADAKAEVYRTDLNGNITIWSDGKVVDIIPEKNAEPTSSSRTLESVSATPTAGVANPTAVIEKTVQKSESTYILNTNTKKIHRPDCKSVNQMKESNKGTYTGSIDDLLAQGYSRCKNCNP